MGTQEGGKPDKESKDGSSEFSVMDSGTCVCMYVSISLSSFHRVYVSIYM